jgi:hypothetical protein
MVPAERRPSAYGVFTAAYGISWFLGSRLPLRHFDYRRDRVFGSRGSRRHAIFA